MASGTTTARRPHVKGSNKLCELFKIMFPDEAILHCSRLGPDFTTINDAEPVWRFKPYGCVPCGQQRGERVLLDFYQVEDGVDSFINTYKSLVNSKQSDLVEC